MGPFLLKRVLTLIATLIGASIVVLQRSGQNVVNPLADEALQADDQLLLLGTKEQLTAAHHFFNPPKRKG